MMRTRLTALRNKKMQNKYKKILGRKFKLAKKITNKRRNYNRELALLISFLNSKLNISTHCKLDEIERGKKKEKDKSKINCHYRLKLQPLQSLSLTSSIRYGKSQFLQTRLKCIFQASNIIYSFLFSKNQKVTLLYYSRMMIIRRLIISSRKVILKQ